MPRDSMIGRQMGAYQVLSLLGAGGMGEVYLARDLRLAREVALKVLPAEMASDPDRMRRFVQEARAASALKHPNVAHIYEIGESEGVHFIAMEHVEGQSLADRMAGQPISPPGLAKAAEAFASHPHGTGGEGKRYQLEVNEIIEIGLQVADALDEAHSKGITHRDIKPANIMLTLRGQVKVLDFGLAKITRPEGQAALSEISTVAKTETGVVMGTLPYMSPEQVLGRETDHRTDIFSLGTVLYEMATGRLPFSGANASETADRILHAQPEAIARFNYNVPPELERMIRKSLEKDRERRYQATRELLIDLRNLKRDSGQGAGALALEGLKPRRRTVLAAAGGVIVLLAALIGLNVGGLREIIRSAGNIGHVRSLAVLPLENLSGEKEQEYFAEGMTDMLTTDLAQVGALRVISHTSVLPYKQIKKPLPEIARELNVDAIVEGTVLRAGDRVRITTQLIEGPTDRHLWAQTYERDLRDVLALQSEVARAITREIKVKLSPQQEERFPRVRTVSPQALEAYLRGAYSEDPAKGEPFLKQAIQLDPTYALPYVGLAIRYFWQGFNSELPPKVVYPKSKEAALKALSLDPNLADAHGYLALVMVEYEWNFPGAEREFERALELNPNQGDLHHLYAHYLLAMGRAEESRAESQRAVEIDPVDLGLRTCLGWHCIYTGQYAEAEEHCRRVLQIDPDIHFARQVLGWGYEQQGKFQEAIAELEKGLPDTTVDLAHAYAASGKTREAEKILAKEIARSKSEYVSAFQIAVIYVGLGEKEQAFNWLEKAYQDHASLLVEVRLDPRFKVVHSDPRFQDLVRRIGLPP